MGWLIVMFLVVLGVDFGLHLHVIRAAQVALSTENPQAISQQRRRHLRQWYQHRRGWQVIHWLAHGLNAICLMLLVGQLALQSLPPLWLEATASGFLVAGGLTLLDQRRYDHHLQAGGVNGVYVPTRAMMHAHWWVLIFGQVLLAAICLATI